MTQFQSFDTPPVTAGDLPATEAGWPKVFGVISVVLGGLGIASNACGAIGGLIGGPLVATLMKTFMPKGSGPNGQVGAQFDQMMDAMRPWMIVSGVLSLVNLGVSVWLLMAGVALLKRKASGVRLHIGWAWVRIAMALVLTGVGVASQIANSAAVAKMQAAQGGAAPAGFTEAFAAAQALFSLAWGMAYPIVVLVFMNKPMVKELVASWSA